jgi:hypothetical protein
LINKPPSLRPLRGNSHDNVQRFLAVVGLENMVHARAKTLLYGWWMNQ